MAAGTPSKGSTLSYGTGPAASGTSYTAIAGMQSIGGVDLSKSFIKDTDLSSTAEEYIPGLIDAGELSFTMKFNKTTYQAFVASFLADTLHAFKLSIPTSPATVIIFNGYISNIPTDIKVNDTVKINGKIRVTGVPTVS